MALRPLNPPFQENWVAPVFKQIFIVVSFQKSGMSLAKVADNVFAGSTNVCKHADFGVSTGNQKTVRIGSIMPFREGCNAEVANANRLISLKIVNRESAFWNAREVESIRRNVNGQLVLPG